MPRNLRVARRVLAGLATGLLLGSCATTPNSPPTSLRAPQASGTQIPSESAAGGGSPALSNTGAAPASLTAPATRTTSAAGGAGGTAKVPAFRASIKTVTAKDLASSWRKGCPVPVAKLRAVDVTHWNRAGAVQTGRLVVAADKAASVVKIMRDLYNARFPIQRMQPIEAFKGNDNASMAANNTSAFNCRRTTGGSSWSEHSYGRAIDVNPLMNPYVRGRLVLPPAGAPYRDRKRKVPGMIHAGDAVVRAFAARGWAWGGNWKTLKDYQHFSTTGR